MSLFMYIAFPKKPLNIIELNLLKDIPQHLHFKNCFQNRFIYMLDTLAYSIQNESTFREKLYKFFNINLEKDEFVEIYSEWKTGIMPHSLGLKSLDEISEKELNIKLKEFLNFHKAKPEHIGPPKDEIIFNVDELVNSYDLELLQDRLKITIKI